MSNHRGFFAYFSFVNLRFCIFFILAALHHLISDLPDDLKRIIITKCQTISFFLHQPNRQPFPFLLNPCNPACLKALFYTRTGAELFNHAAPFPKADFFLCESQLFDGPSCALFAPRTASILSNVPCVGSFFRKIRSICTRARSCSSSKYAG